MTEAGYSRSAPDRINDIIVLSVSPDSPAEKANVLPGDKIISIDDKPISALNIAILREYFIDNLGSCDTVVERDGKKTHLKMDLEDRI